MKTTISHKELRENVGEVLRRAEAGEEFIVTVAARPVVRLGPARSRQWVTNPVLAAVFETPGPQTIGAGPDAFDAELTDPFTE